jgi:chromosome partitioning protein
VKILALYNIKGGVGKTATAVNLAYLSAAEGRRTLLWDLDPQGAATFYFRVKPKVRGGGRKLIRRKQDLWRHVRGTDFELLDLLPADFSYRHLDLFLDRKRKPEKRLRRLLRPLADRCDHLFIDCAPSISLVSESVFRAANLLLIPTIPTTLSMRTLEQVREHVGEMGRSRPEILPFFCMVDLRKTLHRQIIDRRGDGAAGFLETRIPYSSSVERMGLRRAPIETFAAASAAAKVYRRLWAEVRGHLDDS